MYDEPTEVQRAREEERDKKALRIGGGEMIFKKGVIYDPK